MLNHVYVKLLEAFRGQAFHEFAAPITGISSKTLRGGGAVRPKKQQTADDNADRWFDETLLQQGFSEEERENLARVRGFLSGLVAYWKLIGKTGFEISTRTAANADEWARAELNALRSNDFFAIDNFCRHSSTFADLKDWAEDNGQELPFVTTLSQQPHQVDPQLRQQAIRAVSVEMMLRFLAACDAEIFAATFSAQASPKFAMAPRPLFLLLLPRINPMVKPNQDGTYPPRALVDFPLGRLLMLCKVLSFVVHDKRWPDADQINWITELSLDVAMAISEQGEQESITSWSRIRSGHRGLTLDEFTRLWKVIFTSDTKSNLSEPRFQWLFAAHTFELLYVSRTGSRSKWSGLEVLMPELPYRRFWQQYMDELADRGVTFGSRAWPAWIEAQF